MYKNTCKVRVRYAETDQMGYVYYGNYAQFFEIGRVEALRALGVSYKDLEDNGVMLPVSTLQTKYLKPAKYDDELTIVTHIKKMPSVRIEFDYEIFNDKEEKLCVGNTVLVFVDKETMRPTVPPTYFSEKISHFFE